MRRRTLLTAAGGAAFGLAGCASGGSTPSGPGRPTTLEKVTYLTGFAITGQDSFAYLAVEKGFFLDAGLQVQIKPGGGTGANLKLLQGGQAEFAVVDLTGALLEYGRGGYRDFRVFAAVYQRSVSCIMALASRGITVPRDLEGKTVGYTEGGVNKTLFPTYARLAGVDQAKIRWVNLPPPQLRPTLLAGTLDAITEIVIGRPAVEATAGKPVTVLPYSNYLGDLYGNVLATTLSTAMGNPGIVKRFRDALLRGLAHAIAHPEEAGQVLAKHQPTYKAQAATAEVRATEPYVRSGVGIGDIDEARVMQSISLLQGAGAIPDTGLRPADVVSLELVP